MPAPRSIDPLLIRTPRDGYNCLDFVIEAWNHLTGDPGVAERLNALSEGIHTEDGRVILSAVRGFGKLPQPASPCFVVMQRTKTQPHIGIFYKGRILHMIENGVEYQPLPVVRRYFTKIGFYAYAK
jgi:hypothetical protein